MRCGATSRVPSSVWSGFLPGLTRGRGLSLLRKRCRGLPGSAGRSLWTQFCVYRCMRFQRFQGSAAAVLLSASLLGPALMRAQEAPSPTGPPPKSDAPAPAPDEGSSSIETLKIGTNLVNLYFSARDKSGFITNLKKDDCQVYENKEEQEIRAFTQEKKLPLTIGILLDTSGSQQYVLPLEQTSGAEFLKDVLTPKGRGFSDLLRHQRGSAGGLHELSARAEAGDGQGFDQYGCGYGVGDGERRRRGERCCTTRCTWRPTKS